MQKHGTQIAQMVSHNLNIPYSRKIWRGIKFGGLVVYVKTAKLKSAKFCYVRMYVWRYRTISPNLIPIMVLKTSFWAKPPNLMTANISGYTVHSFTCVTTSSFSSRRWSVLSMGTYTTQSLTSHISWLSPGLTGFCRVPRTTLIGS